MTVTELGSDGRGRDHLVLMQPILARNTEAALILNPPFLNRADCRFVRFLNLGGFIFCPFLLPFRDAKKLLNATPKSAIDCCNGILETSLNHSRYESLLSLSDTDFLQISSYRELRRAGTLARFANRLLTQRQCIVPNNTNTTKEPR